MSKRRRTSRGFVVPKRPIDKSIITITITNAGTTQRSTTLKTTTFPYTVMGLRWSFSIVSTLTTDQVQGIWVIVKVPDGETLQSISLTDGADTYAPEQQVLAFGAFAAIAPQSGGSVRV